MNNQIIQGFFESYRADGKSEKTIKSYNAILNKLNKLLDKDLTQLNMVDIDKFKRFMQEKNYSDNTKAQHIMCIKALVKYMKVYGFIDKDFSRDITVPKKKKIIQERNYMSIDEQKQFLAHLNSLKINKTNMTHKLLITLYLTTGGRKNEVLNICKNDIDFINNTIKLHGKGNKERYVALLPSIKSDLNYYIHNYMKPNSNGLIFSYNGKKLNDSTMNKALDRKLKEANLPKYKVHDLRHACASAMFEFGATKDEVQMALGHESVTTTEKIYVHYTKERQMSGFAKNPLFK